MVDAAVPIRVVISYRRRDASGEALHLHADLERRFGENRIFLDIGSIEYGSDFVEAITDAIQASDVLIALIGTSWLTSADKDGHRKIDKQDDPVRLELQLALEHNVRVVPVLVQDAEMPDSDALPAPLEWFARRHAFEISDHRWRTDVGKLIAVLEEFVRDKAQRLAEADAATQQEERARQKAAQRDDARRRDDALTQQALREALGQAKLREHDLRLQLAQAQKRRKGGVAAVLAAVGVLVVGSVVALAVTSRSAATPAQKTVTVSARSLWNETGIKLERGQHVKIVATGTIDTHQPDPARRSGPEGKAGEVKVGANIVPDIGHGALIRRTGMGEPRGVGAESEFTAEEDGWLYLGVNDWNAETNAGFFTAVITVD